MKINFPLLALAIGAFGIGTTEFSPMGLLPVIARGVDVSIPAAGMLISAYAIGVMVGAPADDAAAFPPRSPQCADFPDGDFHSRNVLSAISPDYTTLMLFAHSDQPQPWRLLRTGLGCCRQRGAKT